MKTPMAIQITTSPISVWGEAETWVAAATTCPWRECRSCGRAFGAQNTGLKSKPATTSFKTRHWRPLVQGHNSAFWVVSAIEIVSIALAIAALDIDRAA
jgi:hypothetical protein